MNQDPSKPVAPGYLLTWSTFGTWLHGDDAGSVDRRHNEFGTPVLDPSTSRVARITEGLGGPPVMLDSRMRSVVDAAIRAHCGVRAWSLAALSVRSNHVHVVITEPRVPPEPIVKQLKDWSTRHLRRDGLIAVQGKVWAGHASTRYLFEPGSLDRAIEYVTLEQDGKGIGRFRRENPKP